MPWYRIHLEISGRGRSPHIIVKERKLNNDEKAQEWYKQIDDICKADETRGSLLTKPRKLIRIDVREVTTDITLGELVDEEKR